jgi:methylphosphotriester-DNA--protein-cysteine methyltransferase
MMLHNNISKTELAKKIKSGEITLGSNVNLKIYGLLTCKSGKRMLSRNRVFFINEKEALQAGYRPCGHCMSAAYSQWKSVSFLTAKTLRR